MYDVVALLNSRPFVVDTVLENTVTVGTVIGVGPPFANTAMVVLFGVVEDTPVVAPIVSCQLLAVLKLPKAASIPHVHRPSAAQFGNVSIFVSLTLISTQSQSVEEAKLPI